MDRDGSDRGGARWIEELPAGLAAQQGLLRGLRAFCQADRDVRWLVVGCSLARDAGDWLSDIDAAVGVTEERFADVFPRVRSVVDRLGGLVESYHHKLPGLTLTHQRIFAQYADRSQLDLVVYPATVFAESIPNVVVLYDPDSVLAVPARADSSPVSPAQVREWAFAGWCALADLGKYVRRGSTWEALERLHEARAQVWQLWAAVRGVPQPQYGLTSVLDYSPSLLPSGIEATVSDLDLGRLLAASLRVAELLGEVADQLGDEQRAALPAAMGRFITGDLRAAGAGRVEVNRLPGGRLRGMALLRVDTRPLLPLLRAELVALLTGLSGDDWERSTACPGWSVHGVAAHLFGVELGNVSVRRDHWGLGPGGGEDLDSWLNAFNQQWVEAARRISPALLAELINLAGLRFEEHLATLDLDASGGPVPWATGSDPAPVWLDVAREYMERYVHQQQIRQVTGHPALGAAFTSPVLATAAHALPRALALVSRPTGTIVTFSAEGEGGGSWQVVRAEAGWELDAAPVAGAAACHARTTVDGALKLYARDPSAPPLTWQGDRELAEALAGVKAVLG